MSLPPRPARTIRIYAADGTELLSVQAKSKAQRSSIQGRADQKQIHDLCVELDAAGKMPDRAELAQDGSSTVDNFSFHGSRTLYVGSARKAGQS